jgi:sugar O-acyltransferase (sialic acid O-acetyltransferase NeuD family)
LQGIHERVEDQVRLYSDKVALRSPEAAYTYAEVNGFANSIAQEILSAAGTGLAQAAILQPNTPEIILSILASLKARKAYVPLDPKLPKRRLQAIVDDVEPVVLLADEQHLALAEQLGKRRVRIINTSRVPLDAGVPNPCVKCDPLDRAYILYTSGTTGSPKGIEFLHRNLLHHTAGLTNALYFAPSDRVSWLHEASFAASIVDIYCCITNGGTLYPWDSKVRGFTGMAAWFAQEQLTTIQWIPSAFRQFLRTIPEDFVFEDVRLVVMASEPFTVREVELFRRHFPVGSHIVNQVGTSEAGNYRLYAVDHHIPIEGANVPAGYPASEEREVLILDEERRQVSPGSTGEIGVKTDYMAAGYWRNDALTQDKFARITADGIPVYLTGDMGRLEPDGCLIHLGRKDSQVKIRGYRVELAEIDYALTGSGGVADCVTQVVKNRLGDDQLVSYVLLGKHSRFDQQEVERQLESQLPEYMVPRIYVVMDSFPALPNGKTDYKRLPSPFHRADTPGEPVAMALPSLREEIVRLFAELLQMGRASADSDFLREGGDSLLAAVLMCRIHERFGVAVAIDQFLESPTAGHLASLVEVALMARGRGSPGPSGIVPLTPSAEIRSRIARLRARDRAFTRPAISDERCATDGTSRLRGGLVIIGAGGFGREVFTWATQAIAAGAPWRIKGFLDNRADALNGFNYDARILGGTDTYDVEEGDVFVGAVGDPQTKVRCYTPILEKGGRFVNLIHPLATVGHNVQLGSGIVLGPLSSITCDVRVGDFAAIGALSNLGHDTVVGDWCHISSHCGVNGSGVIGEGAFLGSHACIIPRMVVGEWAFVGAGSVVVRAVPAHVKVFGNPATVIGDVEELSKSVWQRATGQAAG